MVTSIPNLMDEGSKLEQQSIDFEKMMNHMKEAKKYTDALEKETMDSELADQLAMFTFVNEYENDVEGADLVTREEVDQLLRSLKEKEEEILEKLFGFKQADWDLLHHTCDYAIKNLSSYRTKTTGFYKRINRSFRIGQGPQDGNRVSGSRID